MLDETSSRSIVGAVLSVLVGAGMAVPANAGIKDEYQRAQECDYSKAEYGSDVGVLRSRRALYQLWDLKIPGRVERILPAAPFCFKFCATTC